MQPILRLWHSTIGKKIAMAVSGILLVGFLVTHVVSNLAIFTNPEHLDAWGRFLRSTGPLLWIARVGLIVLAAIHIIAALQLIGERPGQWELAVARANTGALAFWRSMAGAVGRDVEELDRNDAYWNGAILRFVVA